MGYNKGLLLERGEFGKQEQDPIKYSGRNEHIKVECKIYSIDNGKLRFMVLKL